MLALCHVFVGKPVGEVTVHSPPLLKWGCAESDA